MPKTVGDWLKALVLLIVIGLIAFGVSERQAITDWIKLVDYTPPAAIAAIADEDTMTPEARHLFYLNRPELENKSAFRQDCPNGTEQTVVLGCYHSGESGIFMLNVSDPRLAGVEQVTAAHEMLHAAYERLGTAEKKQVDSWLLAYYKTIKNPQMRATFASYKQTEPGQLVNEMHSIFGTEIANLPPQLENYYKRYFTDRSKITTYYANYQQTFTTLKQQVASYDSELKSLKDSINSDETKAQAMAMDLKIKRNQISSDSESGNANAYNAAVPAYNAEVDSYNQLASTIGAEIDEYNQIVADRNKLAITINGLGQELNANVPTTIKSAG